MGTLADTVKDTFDISDCFKRKYLKVKYYPPYFHSLPDFPDFLRETHRQYPTMEDNGGHENGHKAVTLLT